ncbi:3TM-type holin [Pseudoalteromonas sp. T1lg23B]|uniref:3TM-type holin n=1 Tax=Pseudoalteromonas sp. T1lg23B TaxID=2077097 RepID=UPI0018FE108F|nr:3TM-type holin [Pseudoalteromonas sp. T1lg23B]
MGLLATLFGSTTQDPIQTVGNILDELFTSEEEVLKQDLLKARLVAKSAQVQAKINALSASHRSVFVAGARPFLLWVCGLGFLFSFVINPILQWLWPDVGAPQLPLDVMLELTLGMLGLAGLRTFEKVKGVAK